MISASFWQTLSVTLANRECVSNEEIVHVQWQQPCYARLISFDFQGVCPSRSVFEGEVFPSSPQLHCPCTAPRSAKWVQVHGKWGQQDVIIHDIIITWEKLLIMWQKCCLGNGEGGRGGVKVI